MDKALLLETFRELEAVSTQLRLVIQRLPEGRERALALTKLDECVLWLEYLRKQSAYVEAPP